MRKEYPRPQFERENWTSLNGSWNFGFDPEDRGVEEAWYKNPQTLGKTIKVPFVYQAKLSGVDYDEESEIVWYHRKLNLEKSDKRVLLHFGAVDYIADVYVNGQWVGQHTGGHTSFKFDITEFVVNGENNFVVRVFDPLKVEYIPRGKQYWKEKPESIWYTNTIGIWQSVWLEEVNSFALNNVQYYPDIDKGTIQIVGFYQSLHEDLYLETEIYFQGELVNQTRSKVTRDKVTQVLDVFQGQIMNTGAHGKGRLWSPENPNLFQVVFRTYLGEEVVDEVKSYFGMRKVHVHGDQIYLNNRPYYQKLILDQGYWPEGLMTAPDDQSLVNDIEMLKLMGFNGARKHQKLEDPRYLYHADKLGFLVWGESASPANFDHRMIPLVTQEWQESISRDFNHPSIIAWTPINESWGISEIAYDADQQHFAQMIYHYVKSIDPTRLVIVNDGWEMIKTDIIGVHNYRHGESYEDPTYLKYADALSTQETMLTSKPAERDIIVAGYPYEDQPIMLTEFGGISFKPSQEEGSWGYTSVSTEEAFLEDYRRIIETIRDSEAIVGFCYTQLSDVEQETNGLLSYDRKFKVSPDKIKEINDLI